NAAGHLYWRLFSRGRQLGEQYGIDFVFGSWFHGKRNREGELTSDEICLTGFKGLGFCGP
ncbi:MAG: hypothetical protein WD272_11075, partial [Balneolales bacterium]